MQVPSYTDMPQSPFIRQRGHAVTTLFRSRSTTVSSVGITGMFRCEIPDASGITQNIFVGVYPENGGRLRITTFYRISQTLICKSTGGPPTTITWYRNGQPLTIDGSTYQQSQRLVDAQRATYDNILYANNINDLLGNFTCIVSNVRGDAERMLIMHDILITATLFVIGQSARITCRSDLPMSMIVWLNDNALVLNRTVSTQQLDLVFPLVNDSNHNQVYTCRITRAQGMANPEQTFIARVTSEFKSCFF